MIYDVIIIGGSAAATSAGIYGIRRGLNLKVITKEFGGEVATSGEIGNWPGISTTDGLTLAQQFKDHLKFYKVDIEEGVEVQHVSKQTDGLFSVTAQKDGADVSYIAKALIVTTGVHPRELKVPGEKEFRGKGVTYCTVCDGPVFAGKVTAVIGGGNSALEAALMLSDIATKVYVLNKNAQFKGEQVLIDNLMTKKNVEIIYNAQTTKISGEQFVNSLEYTKDGQAITLPVDGTFVHIGMTPNSHIIPTEVAKDQFGQIKVTANCETNIPGLYAAGDVTDVAHKQIVIAAGQGAIAALSAVQYLNRQNSNK